MCVCARASWWGILDLWFHATTLSARCDHLQCVRPPHIDHKGPSSDWIIQTHVSFIVPGPALFLDRHILFRGRLLPPAWKFECVTLALLADCVARVSITLVHMTFKASAHAIRLGCSECTAEWWQNKRERERGRDVPWCRKEQVYIEVVKCMVRLVCCDALQQ